MKSKPLTIHEAEQLYKLLKPYVSADLDPSTKILDFFHGFLEKIKETSPEDFLLILELILGGDRDTINNMNSEDILSSLVFSFEENKVLELIFFFSEMTKQ